MSGGDIAPMPISEVLRAQADGAATFLASALLDFAAATKRDVKNVTSYTGLSALDRAALDQFAADNGIDDAALRSEDANDFYECALSGPFEDSAYTVASIDLDAYQIIVVLSGGELLGAGVLGGEEEGAE